MNKTYIQSRNQSIFNKFYLSITQLFWLITFAFIFGYFTDYPANNLNFTIIITFAIPSLYILWLVIFNSGKAKIIEHGLELNEKGVCYIHYGSKKIISWANFSGLKIKNKFPRMVLLKSSNKENIEFSYYTFSSQQRREIFNYLSSK
ncbi:hypothetical protein [Thalassotalea sp. PLHSN55]|uniref:hypothetical protein n=1 Tax=Thalassotalea sp. PLHSN55 TaxID=3435888 RepID=UPI003F851DEB